MFKKTLLEQFKTNKFERRGILCLIGFMIVSIVIFRFIANPKINREKTDPTLIKLLEDYYANKPIEDLNKKKKNNYQKKKQKSTKKKGDLLKLKEPILSEFDPNTIDYNGLVKLGFTSKQANTFLKFRKSGFVVKSPDDLAKVYGIDEELINKLKDYMLLPKLKKEPTIKPISKIESTIAKEEKKARIEKLEINTTTQEELIKIYGIGKIYADIILNYRDRLGGYHNLSQIFESFKFPDSTLVILQNNLTIGNSSLYKLNINEVSFKELLAHPYMTYEDNKILYPYIESRRPIKDLNVIDDILILNKQVIKKIKPYLSIE